MKIIDDGRKTREGMNKIVWTGACLYCGCRYEFTKEDVYDEVESLMSAPFNNTMMPIYAMTYSTRCPVCMLPNRYTAYQLNVILESRMMEPDSEPIMDAFKTKLSEEDEK